MTHPGDAADPFRRLPTHRRADRPATVRATAVRVAAARSAPAIAHPFPLLAGTHWLGEEFSHGCYAALFGPGDWIRHGRGRIRPHQLVHWAAPRPARSTSAHGRRGPLGPSGRPPRCWPCSPHSWDFRPRTRGSSVDFEVSAPDADARGAAQAPDRRARRFGSRPGWPRLVGELAGRRRVRARPGPLTRPRVTAVAADHGIAAAGVSTYPGSVFSR